MEGSLHLAHVYAHPSLSFPLPIQLSVASESCTMAIKWPICDPWNSKGWQSSERAQAGC